VAVGEILALHASGGAQDYSSLVGSNLEWGKGAGTRGRQ